MSPITGFDNDEFLVSLVGILSMGGLGQREPASD